MRTRLLVSVIAGLALVAGVVGCGAPAPQAKSGRSHERPSIGGGYGNASGARATAEATGTKVDYFGWDAYKLTNGLVTVIAVPEVGGRIMEYNLGAHPFLWVNQAELGNTYDPPKAEDEREWRNFGGYKVWPAPQKDWGGPPDPLNSELDGGVWTGKLVSASGPSVTLEMTSPDDSAVTGLQMTRKVTLRAGATSLEVTEVFRNTSKRAITWSIWDVTQVPGALQPGGKPSADAKIFFPLKEKSRHQNGYWHFIDQGTEQWKKIAGGKILETSYAGKTGKIGADSDAGWIAYVDDLHDFTFVKTFTVSAGATYPDDGATVEVYTSGGLLPYMEVEILSPLRTLQPGEEFSFEERWHCAKIGGPIIKATNAGAIKTHPTAAKKGDQIIVSGEFGVFAPGQVTIEFLDKDGKTLATSPPTKVTPATAVTLRATAALPEGASAAMVVLSDEKGKRIGNLAKIPLSAKLAKAPRTNKS